LATEYGEKESELVKFTCGDMKKLNYVDFEVSYMCVACQKDLRSQTHRGKWQ